MDTTAENHPKNKLRLWYGTQKEKIIRHKRLSIFIGVLFLFDLGIFTYFAETFPLALLIPSFHEDANLKSVRVFLPDASLQKLIEEKRELYPYKKKDQFIEALVAEQINAPSIQTGKRYLSDPVEIRRVWIHKNIAYIDFHKSIQNIKNPNPDLEKFLIFGIVRTIQENDSTIAGIRFLIDGKEADFLWGGVDITKSISSRTSQ